MPNWSVRIPTQNRHIPDRVNAASQTVQKQADLRDVALAAPQPRRIAAVELFNTCAYFPWDA